MKNKVCFIIITIFCCCIYTSCHDSITFPDEVNLSEADFLLDSNNIWTYAFTDSLSKEKDTVIVKSLGKGFYDNREPAFIWQLKFKKYLDTNYVFTSKNKDTIRFISNFNRHNRYIKARLLFPLFAGMKWKGEWFNDTVKVIRQEKISVPFAIFLNAFYLEEKWGAFNDYGKMILWYQPHVGFLKIQRREWGFGFLNQTWELIKYEKK